MVGSHYNDAHKAHDLPPPVQPPSVVEDVNGDDLNDKENDNNGKMMMILSMVRMMMTMEIIINPLITIFLRRNRC